MMRMLSLNDGMLTVYSRVPSKDTLTVTLKREKEMWFGYLEMGVGEYYADKQAQAKVVKRVRIHRDRSISNQSYIGVEGKVYRVGRVFHGVNKKNIRVTDISLERFEEKYVAE